MQRPAVWRRPSGRWTITGLVLGTLLVLAGIAGIVGHYRAPHSAVTVALAAATPFLVLAGVVGVVLIGLARQWLAAALAAVVAVWGVALQVPLFTGADAPQHAVHIEVMSFNTHLGLADPGVIVSQVRSRHVDLLMLEEVELPELAGLARAGIARVLPYRVSGGSSLGVDAVLWSRYPLTATRPLGLLSFRFASATMRVPGVATPVTVAAVHVAGLGVIPAWLRDIEQLPAELRRLAQAGGPVIVGGDFNASRDVTQFRDLLDTGYADADDQSGAGFTPTYPADRWYGPLVEVDHVLTRNAVATSFDSLELRGSDHRAVLASVAVPTG